MGAVEVSKLDGLVMQVKITCRFRFLVALAVALIRAASWILGGRVEVQHGTD